MGSDVRRSSRHHPEQVRGDVSGAEIQAVIDGAGIEHRLRPPGLGPVQVGVVHRVEILQ